MTPDANGFIQYVMTTTPISYWAMLAVDAALQQCGWVTDDEEKQESSSEQNEQGFFTHVGK